MGDRCFICRSSRDANPCPFCGKVKVCPEHEHLHRSGDLCFPFAVERDEAKGRKLVATKMIEPGEIVFEERPLVVGPCKHAKKPVCLVCLSPVVEIKECGKCGWPMCSEKCSDSHRAFEECEIISADVPRDGGAVDYQAIMPLRVALLKTNDPTAWEYFLTFMDHCEERRSTSSWAADEKWVTDQISTRWKYGELTKDEIARVEGILDVNTIEFFPYEGNGDHGSRGFYPITSFASHSCCNNTFHKRKPKDEAVARFPGLESGEVISETRAKTIIEEGEEITLHYTGGLKGRLERRRLLLEGWFFECRCERCLSDDELGTNCSTVLCDKCRGNMLPKRPADMNSPYVCDDCGEESPRDRISRLELGVFSKIELAYNNDVEGLEEIVDQAEERLHPHHYLLLIVKWILINLYGRKPGYQNNVISEARLIKKVRYCREYLAVLDTIDAGISHNRGRTLWELYSAEVFLLHQAWTVEQISKDGFKKGLERCKTHLLETRKVLEHSEEGSFEMRIRALAEKALRNINETLDCLDFV